METECSQHFTRNAPIIDKVLENAQKKLKADPAEPSEAAPAFGEAASDGAALLAKAVANSTEATFIRMVGSELAQKYIGE